MKKIILMSILIWTSLSHAQVVLIPEKTVPLETYMEHCHLNGYICSQDYFKKMLVEKNSDIFNNFVENIDLYNVDYRKNLFNKIKNIISNENISLDQADLIIKIIDRACLIEKNQNLILIKNEIKDITADLKNLIDEKSDSDSYLVFKKILTKSQFLRLKYKIKYTNVIHITPYNEPVSIRNLNEKILLDGSCEQIKYSDLLSATTNIHYMPLFNDGQSTNCTTEKQRSDSYSMSNIKLHDIQKPLIYTIAAVALVSFFNQYKVDIIR